MTSTRPRYAVPKDLLASLSDVREAFRDASADLFDFGTNLGTLVEDLRSAYEDASERWQESDRGEAVSSWLSSLEEIAERIETVTSDASELVDDLVELPEKPEDE